MDFSTSPLSATALAARLGLTGLATTGITGTLTLTKSGTTARTATFPDAAITVAGSASALTSGLIPQAGVGGILADSALGTSSITGTLTITKTGTTARTVTFPDAAITVARSDAAQTFTGLQSFDTLTASGQIGSTLATGTAPISVASTTVCPNLNAALLNGATFAAPGAIGGTTPGAGAFTTLTASGLATLGPSAGGANGGSFTRALIQGSDAVANDLVIAGPTGCQVRWQFYEQGTFRGQIGYNYNTGVLNFLVGPSGGVEAQRFDSTGLVSNVVGLCVGTTTRVGSERLLVDGGSIATPSATQICMGAGEIKAGSSISAAGATITGSATGTPSAGQTLIGGGVINTDGGVSCTTLTASSYFGCNGATPVAPVTGYGTPTNGALQASFDATSITLGNLAAAVAKLIVDLKATGLIGA